MSRPQHIPAYRLHRQSGQAIVTLTDGAGGRRDVLLGKHGTAPSRAEYARVIAEWEASGRQLAQPASAPRHLTVNELILSYWRWAEKNYGDGNPTRELPNLKDALRPLKRLYGDTLAAKFGPLALRAVREDMVAAGLCRRRINTRIGRLKRVFRWSVSYELLPATVYEALQVRPVATPATEFSTLTAGVTAQPDRVHGGKSTSRWPWPQTGAVSERRFVEDAPSPHRSFQSSSSFTVLLPGNNTRLSTNYVR